MTTVHYRSVPRITVRKALPGRLASFGIRLVTWFWRVRQRRELWQLSDEQLRDVGLTREIIRREVEKPFWMA